MSGHLPSERNEKETSDINALVNPSGAALAHHNSGIAPSKAFVQALKNFRSWGGAITAILTWLYVGSLAILLLVLERWGERHWFFSLLLFSPPQTFLLPLVILVPLALCTRPKLLGWHISTIIGVCFGYMTFRWTPLPRPEAGSLVVVTHNVGQGNRQQFVSFLDAQKPQIVVLQDARYRASDYSHLFPDYYVSARGEFMLLSRDLIQESMIVESPKWHGRPLAARFEVIHDGKPLVIYDVHMPTPRQQFNRFLSGRVVRRTRWNRGRFLWLRLWHERAGAVFIHIPDAGDLPRLPCPVFVIKFHPIWKLDVERRRFVIVEILNLGFGVFATCGVGQ